MNRLLHPYRLIANAIPDPVCLLSSQATVCSVNPAFCRLLGATENDFLDRKLADISANGIEDIQSKLARWRKSGSPLPSALDFPSSDGGLVKCVAYGCALRPEGVNAGSALILLRIKTRENTNRVFAALNKEIQELERQVVERKRAEKKLIASEARVRMLLDSAGEMIFGIDANARFTFVNPAFLDAVDRSDSSALLGENAFEILMHCRADGYAFSPQEDPIYLGITNNHSVHSDKELFSRSDGSRFPVEYRAFPITQESAVVGAVVTAYDISERIRAQNEILRLNKDLERRVAERTAELELAVTQLAQSEKLAALGNLVAGIAHEINTPIGIGVTSATHLQEKVEHFGRLYRANELTKGDFESYIDLTRGSSDIIVANLSRAADLVRSFKQVAVDQISESRRSFYVKKYIEEIVQSLHPRLKNKHYAITINCPDGVAVNSFPGAFSQIITNLVLNSLIHGFEDRDSGQINLDVSDEGDYLGLVYSDDGCGLGEEGVKRVFDPFYSTRRGRGGTGLGMHVVYNLVTNTFAGNIECTSGPNAGARFSMRLHAPADETTLVTAAERIQNVS